MKWVRLWHDMPTDPKWRVIARKSGQRIGDVIAVYTFLMVEANQEEGAIDGVDLESVAAALDMDESDVEAIFNAMTGRVHADGELTGYEKRNPKNADDSTDRVRRYREKKRAETQQDSRPVTVCNGVTVDETDGNAPDKSREDNKPPLVPPLQGDAPKKSRKKGSRLDPDATLSQENREYAEGEGIGNPDREWERFRDYWISQAGQRGTKLDWDATWRNWCRKSVDMNGAQARDGPVDLEAVKAAREESERKAREREEAYQAKRAAKFEKVKRANE